MKMVPIMRRPPLVVGCGGVAGDIAQLRDQWLEPCLTICPHKADPPHRASQELTALKLNHRAAAQSSPLYRRENTAVRTSPGDDHALAQQQVRIEGEGQWRVQ